MKLTTEQRTLLLSVLGYHERRARQMSERKQNSSAVRRRWKSQISITQDILEKLREQQLAVVAVREIEAELSTLEDVMNKHSCYDHFEDLMDELEARISTLQLEEDDD